MNEHDIDPLRLGTRRVIRVADLKVSVHRMSVKLGEASSLIIATLT